MKINIRFVKNIVKAPVITRRTEDHEFNVNKQLNDLLLAVGKHLNLLNPRGNTLDYDNTVIAAEKWDCENTYVHCKGYCPGVGFVDGVPVYIEGRNGGAPAAFKIDQSVKRCIGHLQSHGMEIKRFRSDSAGDHKKLMRYLDDQGIEFFIRGKMTASLLEEYHVIDDWQEIEIKDKRYRIGSMCYYREEKGKRYRVVISENLDFERIRLPAASLRFSR